MFTQALPKPVLSINLPFAALGTLLLGPFNQKENNKERTLTRIQRCPDTSRLCVKPPVAPKASLYPPRHLPDQPVPQVVQARKLTNVSLS